MTAKKYNCLFPLICFIYAIDTNSRFTTHQKKSCISTLMLGRCEEKDLPRANQATKDTLKPYALDYDFEWFILSILNSHVRSFI